MPTGTRQYVESWVVTVECRHSFQEALRSLTTASLPGEATLYQRDFFEVLRGQLTARSRSRSDGALPDVPAKRMRAQWTTRSCRASCGR